MDWLNICLVSVSMATDSRTVSATDGLLEPKRKAGKRILISLIRASFQFLRPLIAYCIGYPFQEQLEKYVPWIGFTLLLLLGLKSIVEWRTERKKGEDRAEKEEEKEEGKKLGVGTLLYQGLATSIDALCIGFVYLDQAIPTALLIFGIIGTCTFILCLPCLFLGKKVGKFLFKWADLIVGVIFILAGTKILLENRIPVWTQSVSFLCLGLI